MLLADKKMVSRDELVTFYGSRVTEEVQIREMRYSRPEVAPSDCVMGIYYSERAYDRYTQYILYGDISNRLFSQYMFVKV